MFFVLFSSLGSDLLFCESACAKSCFESLDRNIKTKTKLAATSLQKDTQVTHSFAFCGVLEVVSALLLHTKNECGTTGIWPPARARSLSQSRRLPHALDLHSSWHHMYIFQFTHSPETSWKDIPPTRGRSVRRAWP